MTIFIQYLQAGLIAFGFLTRIPLHIIPAFDLTHLYQTEQRDQLKNISQLSLLFYPLVGLVIGVILYLLALLLLTVASLDPLLVAVCTVYGWLLLTGGLHLDGLADTADAWVGGMCVDDPAASKEKTLAIMKDPNAGPMAVIAIVFNLLFKTALVYWLLNNDYLILLLLAPFAARTILLPWFKYVPYVRENGLGSHLAGKLSLLSQGLLIVLSLLLACLLIPSMSAFIMSLLGLAVLFFYWRHKTIKRLGGSTGDVAGALIEHSEVTFIFSCALALGSSL